MSQPLRPNLPDDLRLITELATLVGQSGMEPSAVAELLAEIPSMVARSSNESSAHPDTTEVPVSEMLSKAIDAVLEEEPEGSESTGATLSNEDASDPVTSGSAKPELLAHLTESLVRSLVIELAESETPTESAVSETGQENATAAALQESVTTIAHLLSDQDETTVNLAIELSAAAADEATESFPLDQDEKDAIFTRVENALAAEPLQPAQEPGLRATETREEKMRAVFRSALERQDKEKGSVPDLSISSGTLQGQPGDILIVQLRLTTESEKKGGNPDEAQILCLENCADLVVVPLSRLPQTPKKSRIAWPHEQMNVDTRGESESKLREKRDDDRRDKEGKDERKKDLKDERKDDQKDRLSSDQTAADDWNTFWETVWAPLLDEQQQEGETLKEARELCRLNHAARSQKSALQECLSRNSESQKLGTFTSREAIMLMKRLPRESEPLAGKGFCVVLRVSGQTGARRVLVPFNGATLVNPDRAAGCGFP